MSAYKTPIVCKEIYIPIMGGDVLTISQYKEKYGIDIVDALGIFIDDDTIAFNFKERTKIYLLNCEVHGNTLAVAQPMYDETREQAYDPGNDDAISVLYVGNTSYAWGINFTISKNDELSIDNLKIAFFEL